MSTSPVSDHPHLAGCLRAGHPPHSPSPSSLEFPGCIFFPRRLCTSAGLWRHSPPSPALPRTLFLQATDSLGPFLRRLYLSRPAQVPLWALNPRPSSDISRPPEKWHSITRHLITFLGMPDTSHHSDVLHMDVLPFYGHFCSRYVYFQFAYRSPS